MNRSDLSTKEGAERPTQQKQLTLHPAEAPFSLVLTHDTHFAAATARHRIVRLLGGCIPNLDIHHDQWSFTELDHAEFRREALELAVGCDIMVVATVERESLPDPVSSWLKLWVETREKKESALVCLVGSPGGKLLNTPVQMQLQALALERDLAFFSSGFAEDQQAPATLKGRASEPFRRSYIVRPEGWGINE
jgi:hypothetical protein